MSRSSPSQVPGPALDDSGLSVTVAPRRAADPRYGSVYDLDQFAAAAPVHFHRLRADHYLMVFARRWHTATADPGDPGGYTDYTEDTAPGWVRIGVPSGQRILARESYAIPVDGDYDNLVLTDAVSRSTEYLYLLFSATVDAVTTGVVAHWCHNSTTGALMQIAQETVPSARVRPFAMTAGIWADLDAAERAEQGDEVVFDRGLHFRTPHLLVYGSGPDDRLFLARKPWGRIGTNLTQEPFSTAGSIGSTTEDPRWMYFTGTGWSTDATAAGPVLDHTGAALTTKGAVSVATYRDRSWLATVVASGTDRLARVYTCRGDRPWVSQSTLSLGSVADDSYLPGDGLRFQQHVSPALDSTAMADNETALVYVVNTKDSASGVDTLVSTWGLWPVPH